MSKAVVYDLHGPGIKIKYHDGELVVDGGGTLPREGSFHKGDGNFLMARDEIGERITVVLLLSSRAGVGVSLTVILPEVGHTDGGTVPPDTEITGAAIITDQFQNVIG